MNAVVVDVCSCGAPVLDTRLALCDTTETLGGRLPRSRQPGDIYPSFCVFLSEDFSGRRLDGQFGSFQKGGF